MDQVEGPKHELSLHELPNLAIGQCHLNQLHDTYSQLKCGLCPLKSGPLSLLKYFEVLHNTPKLRENENSAYAFMYYCSI